MDVKNKNRIGYKKTKVGWIPKEWDCIELSNLDVTIEDGDRGKSYPKQHDFTDSGYCLFLNAGNVTSKGFSFENTQFVSQERDELLRKGKLKRGDIIITTRGTIGNFAHYDDKVNFEHVRINSGMAIIRNQDDGVSTYFLMNFLISQSFKKVIHRLTFGSAVPQLTIQLINFFPIVKPESLPEQEAIAEVLECWDKAIRNYEKKIEKKRTIKKGLMQRLLSGKQRLPGFLGKWQEVRLGDVCEIIMGQSPASLFYNKSKEGLPLLQGNNDIKKGFSCPHYWTSQITRLCLPGDILMTVRAPVGEIALSIHKACIGRGICAIRGKTASQRFVFHLLDNSVNAWKAFGQGSTFTAVNSKDIRGFQIAVPSEVKEQEIIADLLSKANDEIESLERKLAILKDQKKFLLNNLVTGTIRLPRFRGSTTSNRTDGD